MLSPSFYTQILSTLGAVFCLIAYAGHQLKWLDSSSTPYNLLNIAGSGILIFIAYKPLQVGFFLMEAVWLTLSIFALYKSLVLNRRKRQKS